MRHQSWLNTSKMRKLGTLRKKSKTVTDGPTYTLSKKVIKWYKVLSKNAHTKSTFRLKNESARFCIKGAHSSVQSRLLDDEHHWGDYLPWLWQSFHRCKCIQETLSTVPQVTILAVSNKIHWICAFWFFLKLIFIYKLLTSPPKYKRGWGWS